jgi:hypothetical protein
MVQDRWSNQSLTGKALDWSSETSVQEVKDVPHFRHLIFLTIAAAMLCRLPASPLLKLPTDVLASLSRGHAGHDREILFRSCRPKNAGLISTMAAARLFLLSQ